MNHIRPGGRYRRPWAILTVVLIACLSLRCTGSRGTIDTGRHPSPTRDLVIVPAGVDSSVAVWAQLLAARSFVPISVEREAERLKREGQQLLVESDSLLRLLSLSPDSAYVIGQADSLNAIRRYNEGAKAYLSAKEEEKRKGKDAAHILTLLERARAALEQSIELDPFDRETRYLLAQVYIALARYYGQDDRYQDCITVLERLTRLEKNEPAFYYNLGECYRATVKWQQALTNYRQAELVYREVNAVLDAQPDSARLFLYIFCQGEAYTQLRDAGGALKSFQRAIDLGTRADDRAAAESYIDWINWDDGNIPGVVAYDSLKHLVASDPRGAKQGFLQLSNQLRTERARREVSWQLALVENILEEYDEAVSRLHVLVQESQQPTDSLLLPPADIPKLREVLRQGQNGQATVRALVRAISADSLQLLKDSLGVALASQLDEMIEKEAPSFRNALRSDSFSMRLDAAQFIATITPPEDVDSLIVTSYASEGNGREVADALCMAKHKASWHDLYFIPNSNKDIAWYNPPIDTHAKRYFEDYGTICFNRAVYFLTKQEDRMRALDYFTQSSMVPWTGRSEAFFEIARLLSNNHASSISFLTFALQHLDQLTPDERIQARLPSDYESEVYRMLYQQLQTVGDFKCAKSFFDRSQEP